jgi:hypothetical protein
VNAIACEWRSFSLDGAFFISRCGIRRCPAGRPDASWLQREIGSLSAV